jgi:hypothetical protein
MARHWFLNDGHEEFRNAISAAVRDTAADLTRPDAKAALGDEHEQCQHFFSKLYARFQHDRAQLTRALICCSRIPDPVLELRYYRSSRRRSKGAPFGENTTGADFALALRVDLPGVIQAERSTLGQAKVFDNGSCRVDGEQCELLRKTAGAEGAAYLMWGPDAGVDVVSANNVRSCLRTSGRGGLHQDVLALGKPFDEFVCDDLIGLWFGKDYVAAEERERPPVTSVGVLFHFLHASAPPPNVAYFGLSSSQVQGGLAPGVYIADVVDMDRG